MKCGCGVSFNVSTMGREECTVELKEIQFCPLHAAAPEMLAALKTAQQAICLYHCQITLAKEPQGKHIKVCNELQAIIVKVEGKP